MGNSGSDTKNNSDDGDGDALTEGRGLTLLHDLQLLEQRLASVHEVQSRQVAAIAEQLADARAGLQASAAGMGANMIQPRSTTTAATHSNVPTSRIHFGVKITLGTAQVVVGPVIGKVTQNTCRVLLELDRTTQITCHISLLDELCPVGREAASATKWLKQGVPQIFHVRGLSAGCRYAVCFSGITEADAITRTGRFRTLRTDGGSLCTAVVGTFDPLPAHAVASTTPAALELVKERVMDGEVDLVIHAGGQVNCTQAFDESAMILQRHIAAAGSGSAHMSDTPSFRAQLQDDVRERFRDAYRLAWNLKDMRYILANSANLMIWADSDVRTGFTWQSDRWGRPLEAQVIHAAQNTFREYQRALWDEKIGQGEGGQEGSSNIVWGNRGTGNEECHFHVFGCAGVLFLDTKGAFVLPDGTQQPESAYLSQNQWDFITFVLGRPEVHFLVVVSENPVVDLVNIADKNADKSAWKSYVQDQQQLLKMLFEWQNQHAERTLVIACGGQGAGSTTALRHDSFPGITLTHLCTGRATGLLPPSITPPKLKLHKDIHVGPYGVTGNVSCVGNAHTSFVMLDLPLRAETVKEKKSRMVLVDSRYNPNAPVSTHSSATATTKSSSNNEEGVNVDTDSTGNGKEEEEEQEEEANDRGARMLIGPVIGKVTDSTAVVLVEMDRDVTLTCVCRDTLSGETRSRTRRLTGERANCFHLTNLRPERRYRVSFVGDIQHKQRHTGLVNTWACNALAADSKLAWPQHVLVAAVADDIPSNADPLAPDVWSLLGRHVHPEWGAPGVVVHLGCQVDLSASLDRIFGYIQMVARGRTPRQVSVEELTSVTSHASGCLRSAYRQAWNLPSKRAVLASCSNLMVRAARDIDSALDERARVSNASASTTSRHDVGRHWYRLVLDVSRSIYHEYQGQLWQQPYPSGSHQQVTSFDSVQQQQESEGSLIQEADDIAVARGCGIHATVLGDAVGVVVIDLLESSIENTEGNGDAQAEYVGTDNNARGPTDLLTFAQWHCLETLLFGDEGEEEFMNEGVFASAGGNNTSGDENDYDTQTSGGSMTNVKVLVVVSEFPIVEDATLDASIKFAAGGSAGTTGRNWHNHQRERMHLLDLLFEWKRSRGYNDTAAAAGREVVLLAGGQGKAFTTSVSEVQSAIHGSNVTPEQQQKLDGVLDSTNVLTVKQLAVGAVTDTPIVFDAELAGSLDRHVNRSSNMSSREQVGDTNSNNKIAYLFRHTAERNASRVFGLLNVDLVQSTNRPTIKDAESGKGQQHVVSTMQVRTRCQIVTSDKNESDAADVARTRIVPHWFASKVLLDDLQERRREQETRLHDANIAESKKLGLEEATADEDLESLGIRGGKEGPEFTAMALKGEARMEAEMAKSRGTEEEDSANTNKLRRFVEDVTEAGPFVEGVRKAFNRYADEGQLEVEDVELMIRNFVHRDASAQVLHLFPSVLLSNDEFQDASQPAVGGRVVVDENVASARDLLLRMAVRLALHERDLSAFRYSTDSTAPLMSQEVLVLVRRVMYIIALVRQDVAPYGKPLDLAAPSEEKVDAE